jgi:outer membrane PBP1 activator LpoA protein
LEPLARNDVDALIQANLKLRILALNDVSNQAENVWQFSLSKKQDADALHQVLKQDKIKQLYVLRQKGRKLKVNFF